MNLKTTACVLALLFFCFPLISQVEKDKTQVQIIDFGGDDASESKPSIGLIIKTDPLAFLTGKQMILAEKELSTLVSVEGGLGLTFRNFLLGSLNDGSDPYGNSSFYGIESGTCESQTWNNSSFDACDAFWTNEFRTFKIGPRISASLRLFFDNDGFEGLYIAPSFTFSRYNAEVQKVREGIEQAVRNPNDTFKEFENHTDFSVRFGQQILGDKLCYEYYAGIGLRQRIGERLDIGQDENGFFGNAIHEINETNIILEFGLRVGLQL